MGSRRWTASALDRGNPDSRLSRHPDPDFYERHGLDALTFDRPGYGRSACRALLADRVSAIAIGGAPSPPTRTPGWEANLLPVNRRSLELVRHDRAALDDRLREAAERLGEDPPGWLPR